VESRRLKFEPTVKSGFYPLLSVRVNDYFKRRGISKKANRLMRVKIIFCLSLFFSSYVFILSGFFSSWTLFAMVILFGISGALVGFNIGHDAVHNALFKSAKLNRIFGYSFELIGMSSYAWYLKHNMVHHTNPNVCNADFDIEASPLLRLSPADKLLPYHRWQHWYAPLPYMLFSLSRIFFDDFYVVLAEDRTTIDNRIHPQKEKILLFVFKSAYIFMMLMLPMLLLPLSWWQVIVGFLLMHFILSIILAFILVPAHLFESTCYHYRNSAGKLENDWAEHQMQSTIDYAAGSHLCNFLFGGFNINVAHHLFPHICHVHLIDVSKIVRQTAEECGVTYHHTTLWGAMVSHFRALKRLGRQENFHPSLTFS